MHRIALISVHGCPLAELGTKNSGGMNVYVKELAQGLDRLGFRVDIFTRNHKHSGDEAYEFDENARVVHIDAGPVDAPKETLYDYLPGFLERIRAFRERYNLTYELLHSHYWLSGWVADILAKEWGIPHVATFHTLAEVKSRAHIGEDEATHRSDTERRIAACADRIVVSTAHERDALHHLYDADEVRVRVVPGGVDISMFQPGDQRLARDRLGLNGHHTILYVGRLDPIKGVEVLMHTVAQLETTCGVQLLIVGGTPEDAEYRRFQGLISDLDVTDKIEFLGTLEHEALPTYYQAADVCVLPSYYESFGLVALEAMACGTPVVASRVPGLQSIVSDSRSGYIVPWHCPDAFADRLEVLLANDSLRRSMGENARVIARAMSWDGTAAAVAAVYAELGVG